MDRPAILHLFTPGAQASPFDVNMAADAGFQVITPYCHVALEGVAALTQDAIFSRGPKGVARTGIFIGGRDAMLAADMLDAARRAMVPPFEVSVFADPSGAYTTAAALVACVEAALRRHHQAELPGRRVLLLGGTGPVGRIAGVLCARQGAAAVLASHKSRETAAQAAAATGQRFGVALEAASSADSRSLRDALAGVDVVLGVAAAGVQVLSAEDRDHAPGLLVAADVNAVPPAGLAGVGVTDNGKPVEGTRITGIGALAVGDVKYKVQNRLLARMVEGGKVRNLDFSDAFQVARELLA